MSRKKDKHYIDGERFTQLCVEARETGEFGEELLGTLYVLSKRTFEHRPGTPRHSYIVMEKEDAVQEAVMLCLKEFEGFDPERGTAYTYFRSVIRTCYRILSETASREKLNPGNSIFNIDGHTDIETDNRISYLLLESQRESEQSFKKLQPDDIVEIKRRLEAGEVGAEIARDYDVDQSTVSKIKTGKLWGDV